MFFRFQSGFAPTFSKRTETTLNCVCVAGVVGCGVAVGTGVGFPPLLLHVLLIAVTAAAAMLFRIWTIVDDDALTLPVGIVPVIGTLVFAAPFWIARSSMPAWQALILGFLVFNVVVVTLWWIDFARQPTPGIRGGIRRLARLPRVSPIRDREPVRVAASDEWSPSEAFAPAAEAWRKQIQNSGAFRTRNGDEYRFRDVSWEQGDDQRVQTIHAYFRSRFPSLVDSERPVDEK